MQWKHNFRFSHSKGRTRVTCLPCGVSSPWFDRLTEDELLVKWCNRHSAVREVSHRAPPPAGVRPQARSAQEALVEGDQGVEPDASKERG